MGYVRAVVAASLLVYGAAASADVGASLRAGTLGAGVEFNVGLSEKLNARLGYSMYDYDQTVEDTDVVYDGTLKLSNSSALLDWHAFGGGFRLSLGAIGTNSKVDVLGRPTAGAYEIGDRVFTAAEVGQLKGKVTMGRTVAPYVGFGWGNPVDAEGRITVLLDIGAAYMGSPQVELTAVCGVATASRCDLLQAEADREEQELAEESKMYEWYPVMSLGFAVRF